MAKNQVSPRENQVLWTISNESTPIPIEDNPPSYNQYIASTMVLVPEGNDLHYSQIIPYRQPSNAKIERKNGRVLSDDPLINRNSNELWLYFMTYLKKKPRLIVTIRGYHYESYEIPDRYRAMRAHNLGRNGEIVRIKTDFNYSIDLTPYISDHYHRITVLSEANSTDRVDLKTLLERYIQSKDSFKEILCSKQLVGWNFDEIRHRIRRLILSTGYKDEIRISFSYDNHEIVARSSSKLNRYSKSIWMSLLCIFTCLWIVFIPIYNYLRKKSQMHQNIVAEYKFLSTTKMFLQRNTRLILNATLMRSKQRFLAVIS